MKIVDDIISGRHLDTVLPLYAVDVETTMRCKEFFSATPHYADNQVLCGYAKNFYSNATYDLMPSSGEFKKDFQFGVIGHHVKFDLHYMVTRMGFNKPQIVLAYDTQYMHYILTGQQWASLDDCLAYWGLPPKYTTIAGGKDTETVTLGELQTYCKHDVSSTLALYEILISNATGQQLVLFNIQARATMALFDMESNGITIDKEKLYALNMSLQGQQRVLQLKAHTIISGILQEGLALDPVTDTFKQLFRVLADSYTTPSSLNQLLLGRPMGIVSTVYDGTYKNGKHKTKKVRVEFVIPNEIPYSVVDTYANHNKNLGYSMDESALATHLHHLKGYAKTSKLAQLKCALIEIVQEEKKINKTLSTYVRPIGQMLTVLRPSTIHTSYSQAGTDTGRLSSANPNVQNWPPAIKELMGNRFNKEYPITTLDFKQLEVFGAAYVSGDKSLLRDLLMGVDIHGETGDQAGLNARTDEKVRRDVKGVVFGTIYGGGKKRLSEQSGVPENIVGKIQTAFFDRYPELKAYYKEYNKNVVTHPCVDVDTVTTPNSSLNTYRVPSVTGQYYFYKERFNKATSYRLAGVSVSYTETCNYPIQGWATGNVVPAFLGLLRTYKNYYDEGEYLKDVILTNTVHDSVDMEGNFPAGSVSEQKLHTILRIMAGPVLKALYDAWVRTKPLPFELKIDVKSNIKQEKQDAS